MGTTLLPKTTTSKSLDFLFKHLSFWLVGEKLLPDHQKLFTNCPG